jgi:hypothetical protein
MRPEVSIPVALATGGVVVGVYSLMQPSMADQRTVQPTSDQAAMLASTEQNALLVSIGVVGAISLIAKDPAPFWVGGLVAVALSWSGRFSRTVDPATNALPGALGNKLQGQRFNVEAAG